MLYLIVLTGIGIVFYYLYNRERKRTDRLERIYLEDALKFIFHRNEKELPASVESLKGILSLSVNRIYKIVEALRSKNLVRISSDGIYLEEAGREIVLQIIRAHRLWETYLEHETDLPLHEIHRRADLKEHELSGARLEALDAHLGYPETDPHGDPIPAKNGRLKKRQAFSMAEWPAQEQAVIAHIEDEPYQISKKLFKSGLRPGQIVTVIEKSPDKLTVRGGGNTISLNSFEAMNIQVEPAGRLAEKTHRTLLNLAPDETGIIVGLSTEIQGLARRRLLDLGITPGARVRKALTSSFGGDPTAYLIRGAKVALRKEQSSRIFIEQEKSA
jgi:DtxR family Mn-dependent transcriptional regulator